MLSVNLSARPSATNARKAVVSKASWRQLTTVEELASNNGRIVKAVEGSGKVLIQRYNDEIYAVANTCPHLGLPIQGKVMGRPVEDGCVVCPFHNTKFDLQTGEVQGEWAPGFPNVPFVGKLQNEKKPIATYETRVTGNDVEVNV